MKKRAATIIRILLALLFFIIAVSVDVYLKQMLVDSSQLFSAAVKAAAFAICFWMWQLANRKVKERTKNQ